MQKIVEEHQDSLMEKWNSTLAVEVEPLAVDVSCTDHSLRVVLADGREISAPLIWFPRLQKATPQEKGMAVDWWRDRNSLGSC
jgi:hypothetical protein